MTATTEQMEHASATATLRVEGMNCASCVNHVTKAAMRVAGVESCDVSLATGNAVVVFDPALTNPQAIGAAITETGYTASLPIARTTESDHEDHAQAWRQRAIIGVILWLPVELTHWAMTIQHGQMQMPWMTWLSFATGTASIIYVGGGFYAGAWRALRRLTSNMDTLIALGASVAYGYSVVALFGHVAGVWGEPRAYYFMEASGLLALISLGHWLEARARSSAGSAIRELLTLAPATAMRLDGEGNAVEIALSEVVMGDRLLVRPGDRVATDGVVIEGRSSVDEAMMSGEPLPVVRSAGDVVIGGTLNLDGRLVIEAKKVGAQTALAQMVALVEAAQSAKPPVQKLADNIAAVFVPVVVGIALVTGAAWYAWGTGHSWVAGETWAAVANATCSVLIIACPCALGLALPAALMVGTGLGARRGILIRDLDALQRAASVKIVVLDKTGTLTEGKPVLQSVTKLGEAGENEILALAAAADQSSSHPLAVAVVAAAKERAIKLPAVERFVSLAGYGVVATIDDRDYLVGSEALLARHGWKGTGGEEAQVYVAEKKRAGLSVLGALRFTDAIKADAAAAIASLHAMGLRTVLLSGDAKATAEAVAKAVGIDEVYSRVKPAEKAAKVRELQKSGPVAMVGDGINDAPALAAADLGIAIGSGSDIAKEAGGIVLVGGRVADVAAAIRLSRATMRTIDRNLFFAFAYNVLAIPLAALGMLNPLISAGAMALSDVTVVGSALLLRWTRLDPEKKT